MDYIHEIWLMTLANHPEARLKTIRIFSGKAREYLDHLIFKIQKCVSLF